MPTVTQQINLGDRTRPLWLGVSPQHRGGWAAPVVVPGPARRLGRSHDKYRETDSSEDEAHLEAPQGTQLLSLQPDSSVSSLAGYPEGGKMA